MPGMVPTDRPPNCRARPVSPHVCVRGCACLHRPFPSPGVRHQHRSVCVLLCYTVYLCMCTRVTVHMAHAVRGKVSHPFLRWCHRPYAVTATLSRAEGPRPQSRCEDGAHPGPECQCHLSQATSSPGPTGRTVQTIQRAEGPEGPQVAVHVGGPQSLCPDWTGVQGGPREGVQGRASTSGQSSRGSLSRESWPLGEPPRPCTSFCPTATSSGSDRRPRVRPDNLPGALRVPHPPP